MHEMTITGRLTADPVMRDASGTEFCKFRVASKNVGAQEAEFFNVTVWGKTAPIAHSMLQRGSSVTVIGPSKVNRWQTKEGEQRLDIEISARSWEGQGNLRSRASSETSSARPTPEDAAIPF